ncbi:MAG: hypothetical protein WC254_07155 [Candidatus Woesearchaeota archaeon]|jgi:hypothetical protein
MNPVSLVIPPSFYVVTSSPTREYSAPIVRKPQATIDLYVAQFSDDIVSASFNLPHHGVWGKITRRITEIYSPFVDLQFTYSQAQYSSAPLSKGHFSVEYNSEVNVPSLVYFQKGPKGLSYLALRRSWLFPTSDVDKTIIDSHSIEVLIQAYATTAAHEIGHLFGLEHQVGGNNLMDSRGVYITPRGVRFSQTLTAQQGRQVQEYLKNQ